MDPTRTSEDRLPDAVAADEIVVVRTTLAVDEATHAAFVAMLAPDERERAARYRFPRDRRRSIASRGWLRTILAGVLRVPPAALVLSAGPHGKPALASSLSFNVSHAETHLVVVLGRDRALGVDIEGGDRPFDVDELARVVFTESERQALAGFAVDAQRAAFLRAWTRKEAYLKARAVGLSLPLTDFSVALGIDAGELSSTVDPAEAARFALAALPAPPRFELTVAWERTAVPVRALRVVAVQ